MMDASQIFVTTISAIPVGEGRTFVVAGREIAIFHTHEGSIHATQAHCPHLNGPLADGLIGGTTLICPLHDRTFDLRTGCGLSHEHLDLAVFKTAVDKDGKVWLDPRPSHPEHQSA